MEHGRSIRLIRHVDSFADFFYNDQKNDLMIPTTQPLPRPKEPPVASLSSSSWSWTVNKNQNKNNSSKTREQDLLLLLQLRQPPAPQPQSSPLSSPTSTTTTRTRIRKQKHVQFDLQANQTFHALEPRDEAETKRRWFTAKELQRFRRETVQQRGSKTAAAAPTPLSLPRQVPLLPSAAASSHSMAVAFQTIVKALYFLSVSEEEETESRGNTRYRSRSSSCCSSSSSSSSSTSSTPVSLPTLYDWEDAYVDFLSQHPDWVGMERYALEVAMGSKTTSTTNNKKQPPQSPPQQRRLQRTGKQQQRQQQLLLLQGLQYRKWNAEPRAEFIRHSCESLSRPSRSLARRLALLQATRVEFLD
ncbi:hypothetical protein ACA910_009277 [Epithemia clementina (nom. ined.)]